MPKPRPDSFDPFRISVAVKAEDIDELDHVNNSVYLRWVQAAAVAHWKTIASTEAQSQTVWVVLRHEIDFKVAAVAGDEIVAETWVGEATQIRFERFTEITRASDGRLLATARTLWCPLDVKSRRPKRVSAEVRAQFSTIPCR
jgi:acyl-CoA thioester hydrolase